MKREEPSFIDSGINVHYVQIGQGWPLMWKLCKQIDAFVSISTCGGEYQIQFVFEYIFLFVSPASFAPYRTSLAVSACQVDRSCFSL